MTDVSIHRIRRATRSLTKRLLARTGLYRHVPRVGSVVDRIDPSLSIGLRVDRSALPPVGFACVYREANQNNVLRLLADRPEDSYVALWALDRIAEQLRDQTIGCGPGKRFELLNRCITALPLTMRAWLVVSDDDVAFRRGSWADAVRIARAAGFALSQPAHSWTSFPNWAFTRRRPFVIARRGSFVEIGPVIILSPQGRRLILPLPETPGMGWGTEAEWAALEDRGLRLGVLDAVLIDHLRPMGDSYDRSDEYERERKLVAQFGLTDLSALQRDHARWTVLRQVLAGGKPKNF